MHQMELILFESNLGDVLEYFMGLGEAEIIVKLMGANTQSNYLQQLVDIGLPAPIERNMVDRDAALERLLILLTR